MGAALDTPDMITWPIEIRVVALTLSILFMSSLSVGTPAWAEELARVNGTSITIEEYRRQFQKLFPRGDPGYNPRLNSINFGLGL